MRDEKPRLTMLLTKPENLGKSLRLHTAFEIEAAKKAAADFKDCRTRSEKSLRNRARAGSPKRASGVVAGDLHGASGQAGVNMRISQYNSVTWNSAILRGEKINFHKFFITGLQPCRGGKAAATGGGDYRAIRVEIAKKGEHRDKKGEHRDKKGEHRDKKGEHGGSPYGVRIDPHGIDP